MKHHLLAILSFLIIIFPPIARADSKTDYEYQLSQYRRHYAEFTQLKRDYLANPTLDNQQKSVILAKQVLLDRDLAKSSYTRLLVDEIKKHNTNFIGFDAVINRLNAATAFYNIETNKSQEIITPNDLKKYSQGYLKAAIIPDRSMYYGQVAAKLASLLQFQNEASTLLSTIYPKLPVNQPVQLKARLTDIPTIAQEINTQIASLAAQIIPEFEDAPINSDQYFLKFIESLTLLRSRQLSLIDQLIDIDINYAQL